MFYSRFLKVFLEDVESDGESGGAKFLENGLARVSCLKSGFDGGIVLTEAGSKSALVVCLESVQAAGDGLVCHRRVLSKSGQESVSEAVIRGAI